MLRTLLDARPLMAMLVSASVGVWGVVTHPWPPDNVYLEIIALRDQWVFDLLGYDVRTERFELDECLEAHAGVHT